MYQINDHNYTDCKIEDGCPVAELKIKTSRHEKPYIY